MKIQVPVAWSILYYDEEEKDWNFLTTTQAETPEEALKLTIKGWWAQQSPKTIKRLAGSKIRAYYPSRPGRPPTTNRRRATLPDLTESAMKITKRQLQKLIQESINEQLDGMEELKKKDPFSLRRRLEDAVHEIAGQIDSSLEISEDRMMDDPSIRRKYTELLVELGNAIVEFKLKFNDIKKKWNSI